MEFETSKNLGLIGAILMFISYFIDIVINWGAILGLVGIILVLAALYGLAGYYNERGIFNNMIYSIIIIIVGVVVTLASVLVTAVGVLLQLGFDFYDMSSWNFAAFDFQKLMDPNILLPLIGAIIIALIVFTILMIFAAIFFRRSMRLLSDKTGVGLFATTGLIMLIGAILLIILVGFILIWIVWLLLAIAFYRIEKITTQPVETKT